MKLSLQLKLVALGAAGMLSIAVLGIAADRLLTFAAESASNLQVIGRVQRSQMYADMMHDAIRGDFYHAMTTKPDAPASTRDEVRGDIKEHAAKLRSSMADALAGARDSALIASLTVTTPILEAYIAQASELTELALTKRSAVDAHEASFNKAFEDLEERMDAVGKGIIKVSEEMTIVESRGLARARITIAVLSVIAFLAIALFCYRLTTRISRAVLAVAERAERLRVRGLAPLERASVALSHGDLTVSVDVDDAELAVDSDDEIGEMARSINGIIRQTSTSAQAFTQARDRIARVVSEIDRLVDAAVRGELDIRAEDASHNGAYRALVGGMNRMLDAISAPLADATSSLARIADCDLTARMDDTYRGQFGRVAASLNSAAVRLQNVLGEVQAAAGQVNSAGEQIASGSTLLANDTSTQAATLSTVTEQLRQLADVSTHSVASVREAQTVVGTSRTQAEAGMVSMQRLSEAMAEIQRASNATAKVAKTIEEIAFQTNLLALNAAVEAARAGDAGNGFAVVADEVRSLALRSAEAAKNTSSLIDEAVQSTARGAALNGEVVAAFDAIQRQVIRATEVMSSIGDGSRAQASGVQALNKAVIELSAAAQRGAANAEESASAAEELQAQASTMASMVNEFQLDDSRSQGRTRTSPTASPSSISRFSQPIEECVPA